MITPTPRFGSDQDDPDAVWPDPLALLALWLPQPAGESRPLMTLSTIDADGYPDSRSVLLSGYDGAAAYFHTDVRSRKVAELAADPRVSLLLVWPELGRQVVIQGDATPTSEDDAAQVYAERSRYLQLLAWTNNADSAALPTEMRRERWAAFANQHPDGSLSAPATWIGYRVIPRRITFWRGDPAGPSTRVEYLRSGDSWLSTRLPG